MDFEQSFTLAVVIFLVYALYKELFNPALTFFIAAVALLLGGVITPSELLKGLSNQQIIIIFLLIIVTSGIRSIFGPGLFAWLFSEKMTARRFMLRMMIFVSSISAFFNNTPVVAFMIPYVQDWAKRTGNPASKFLIPLSFATTLGGMITVIGTSTSLLLNGLIQDYNLTMLTFEDFFFLGLIVTVTGMVYLYFIGYKILPAHAGKLESITENLKEYIVETEVSAGSKIIGKSVKDAGLRNLSDLFLVEIARGDEIISPVSPDEVLKKGDLLFFSGNTDSIYHLIKSDNGIGLRKLPLTGGQFNFVEAVVPANSDLIGLKIKRSDFRKNYGASIVALHRDGKRVAGKIGETELSGGDFLLLVTGDNQSGLVSSRSLFFLSIPKVLNESKPKWLNYLGGIAFSLLILGILNVIPLFYSCIIIISLFVFLSIIKLTDVKNELDLGLFMILVCSLALGVALEKSGAANLVAGWLILSGKSLGNVAALTALFVFTLLLTSLITNAAAVSIAFPVAMSMADQLHISTTPFFVAIAFAASGSFLTPIGYQTSLMVYGPGGYSFKDFVRVGAPLALIYTTACLLFITYFYQLV